MTPTRTNESRPADDGIVIAGGGLAGQRCAEGLRRGGYDGAIRLVCAERHRPYDRPPLSKGVLTGTHRDDELPFRSSDWYERESIDLLLGTSACKLLPAERRLWLSDGSTVRYDQLLIATGSRPRALPLLAGYDNVSELRTLDDSSLLREVLASRPRLAIIGAGFIGLEIAATARKLGVEVTLIEAATNPLVGVLGHEMAAWFTGLHTSEGVEVLTNRTVERIDANSAVRALQLSDGSRVEVDHVVVGIGVEPEVSWLDDTGLGSAAGVPVDAHGRTCAERIFAAGDAAATFDPAHGSHIPGSHWEAAGRQGTRTARLMLGLDPGPAPLTSFWTDQYGIRIQYLGHARLADAVEIDGEPESRDFTATFTKAGRAVAALLVDRPRLLPAARNMIEKGTS